jgi:AraC family transcriptional regulator
LRRIRGILDDPDATTSVASLALEAGVHPVYLARKFRAAFGTSIREYRQITRLRRAIQLVAATTRPLSRIAHECGFADHSHMCRAFRAVIGWHPSALRDPRSSFAERSAEIGQRWKPTRR